MKSARSCRTRALSAAVSARTVAARRLQHLLPGAQPLMRAADPLLELGAAAAPATGGESPDSGGRRPTRARRRRARDRAGAGVAGVPPLTRAPRRKRPSPTRLDRPASARLAETGKIAGSGTIARQVLPGEGQRLGQLRGVQQIGLGHHEQQPIAGRAQDPLLEELPLGRRSGSAWPSSRKTAASARGR